MPLTALAAHAAAPLVLLQALSRTGSAGVSWNLALTLLARPDAPHDVIDTALATIAEHAGVPRPHLRVARGARRRDVVRELADHVTFPVAILLLRGGPEPDWAEIRKRVTHYTAAEDGEEDLFALAMDTAADLELRLDAALVLLRTNPVPRISWVLRLAELATSHPALSAALRDSSTGATPRELFTAASRPYPAWVPTWVLARRMRGAGLIREVEEELIRAGARRDAVTLRVAQDSATPPDLLSMLAHHAQVPLAARQVATWRMLTEPLKGNDPARHYFYEGSAAISALLRAEGIAAEWVARFEGLGSVRWEHALQVVTSEHLAALTVQAVLDELDDPDNDISSREVVAARLSVHPAATCAQRARAAAALVRLVGSRPAADARELYQFAAAGALLPDLGAAGALLPVTALTAHGGGSLDPLTDAALSVLLPHLATAQTATACVTLAPLFTGTLGELVATSCAVGA